ncbi:MAG: ABC transporter permease [Candidatus Heimdallarchaeota archaeon]
MTATYTLWHKHMRKMLAQPAEITGMLIQPILWVVLFGVGMKSMFASMEGSTGSYIAFMAPGIIALTALGGAIAGGSVWLNERREGTIKEYLAAPIFRTSILAGNASSVETKVLIQVVVIFLVSLVMGAKISSNPLELLGALILIIAFGLGFAGIALAIASVTDSPEAYHMMIMILNLPLLFASNALYPIEVMPDWMKVLAYLNPVTYLISGLRELLFTNDNIVAKTDAVELWLCFVIIALFAFVGMFLAKKAFKKSLTN